MELVGKSGAYGRTPQTFEVDVYDSCKNLVITTSSITSGQIYDVDSGNPLTLGIAAFTMNSPYNTYCPPISYDIIDNSTGLVAPSALISMSGNNVVINSNNYAYINTYTFRLTGTS